MRHAKDVEAGQRGRGSGKQLLLNTSSRVHLELAALRLPALLRLRELALVLALLEVAKLLRLALDLLRLLEQVHEHGDLRAQHLRLDGLEQVIDGADRIALEHVRLAHAGSRQENDRGVTGPVAFADQGRRLESVHAGHEHVHQDEREIVPEQTAQRLGTRMGLDQIPA